MPKQKYFSKDPNQLSLFDGCDNSQQSEPPSKSPDESEDIESPKPDSLTKSANKLKAVEQLQSAPPSKSQNSSRDIEPPQPNSPSQSTRRPVDTEGTLIINYAENELREKMIQAGMQTRKDPNATERLMKSDLAKAFLAEPRGLSRTSLPSGNSRTAFEKLSAIAQKNDELLNRAIGKALQDCGLVSSFRTEVELCGRINLRSDLLCSTDSGLVRLELMWAKWVYPTDIANYVLKKLQNYGRAIGLFD